MLLAEFSAVSPGAMGWLWVIVLVIWAAYGLIRLIQALMGIAGGNAGHSHT